MKNPVARPRYRFCWWCSNKLVANYHRVVMVDGLERIVHAACEDEAKASDGK